MSDQASETPLLELLRAIPLDAIGAYEHSPTHHSSIPYGYYASRAADTIESLQRENEELRRIASEKHDEVLALEAAAITPEMRERIRVVKERQESFLAKSWLEKADGAYTILRDLLGEQGE